MKRRIENLTLLFIMTFMLLAGCSGCGQKTAPGTPVTPPNQSTPNTPQLSDIKQNETSSKPRGKTAKLSAKQFNDFEYLSTLRSVDSIEISREDEVGIPTPWDPIVVPLEWWKNQVEKSSELRIARRQNRITAEEYTEIALQGLREYGLVASARLHIELGVSGYKVRNVVNLAYAENPDDFDTLLMWVYAGGGPDDRSYGEEKTAATRRLYEMNPDHPWVSHYLAKCLLGPNPQEALVYAQRAQALDARYLRLGLEGACYYQLGDYDKALASLNRSYRYAVDTSQPSYIIGALGLWYSTAKSVADSGGKGEAVREKIRKAGNPLLGPDLPIRLFR